MMTPAQALAAARRTDAADHEHHVDRFAELLAERERNERSRLVRIGSRWLCIHRHPPRTGSALLRGCEECRADIEEALG